MQDVLYVLLDFQRLIACALTARMSIRVRGRFFKQRIHRNAIARLDYRNR